MRILHLFVLPVAGAVAALGQAPWGLWPLALLAYALALAALGRSTRPFLAGWVFGAAHFGLALIWITEPFQVDAAATAWLAPIALGLVALGFGLFWAVAAWLGRRWLGGPVGVAVAIAAVELLRSFLLSGFPWALPGHILIASPALAAASWLGAHGLGLAVLLGAGLVATRRPIGLAAGFALWLLPLGLGLSLPAAPQVAAEAPVIRLIQPNAPQHLKWDPEWMGTFWRRGLAETAASPEGAAPAAVLWPETALPEILRHADDLRPILASAAGGVPVLIGAQRFGEDRRPRNTSILLTGDDGEVSAIYDKHRLVPFGEFLPFPGVFDAVGLGPLSAQLAGGYQPGDGPQLLDMPGIGPVLPLICYEAIFPQILRATERPRVIFHLTNDAWFGTGIGPQQHLALARLRAAESGLPLLRAANTGISAVIDARGTILQSLPMGVHGHLDAALPPALSATPYHWTGDWALFCVLLILICGLAWRHRAIVVEPLPKAP